MNIISNTKQITSDNLINEVTDQFNEYLKVHTNVPVEFDYSSTSYSVTLNLPQLEENAKVFTITALGKDIKIDKNYTQFDGSDQLYKTLISFVKTKVK